jgi:phosphoglycolate phosphatase
VPIDKIVELANHQIKPDPIVLLEICAREGYAPENSAYVGDSIARDILMAKQAGVFAIWAAYGAEHDPVVFNDLVRISHWTA